MSEQVSQLTEVMVNQGKQSEQIKAVENKLEGIQHQMCEIHSCLIGNGKGSSLVMRVDRLEQSKSRINAVLWFLFTSVTTTIISLIAGYFGGFF